MLALETTATTGDDMEKEESQVSRPLLATFAVERTDSPDIPGHYSSDSDVWVFDGPNGETPIIALDSSVKVVGPITKVQGERDQIETSALLEVTTKTRHEVERDDTAPGSIFSLPELATKTEVVQERDDTLPYDLMYLMELVTRTMVQRERDDQ